MRRSTHSGKRARVPSGVEKSISTSSRPSPGRSERMGRWSGPSPHTSPMSRPSSGCPGASRAAPSRSESSSRIRWTSRWPIRPAAPLIPTLVCMRNLVPGESRLRLSRANWSRLRTDATTTSRKGQSSSSPLPCTRGRGVGGLQLEVFSGFWSEVLCGASVGARSTESSTQDSIPCPTKALRQISRQNPPVVRGSGVRGLHRVVVCRHPLTPDPSPPSTGERGGRMDRHLGNLFVTRS